MNNKGVDQTVRMRGLVCVFVVRKPRKSDFLVLRSINIYLYMNTKSKKLSIIGILDWYLIGCRFFVNVNVLVHVPRDCACPHAVIVGDFVTLCNSPPCWHEPEVK